MMSWTTFIGQGLAAPSWACDRLETYLLCNKSSGRVLKVPPTAARTDNPFTFANRLSQIVSKNGGY